MNIKDLPWNRWLTGQDGDEISKSERLVGVRTLMRGMTFYKYCTLKMRQCGRF